MTDTDLDLVACQLGDCRNRAALTVTVELPTSWTESREYTTRTLLVAVCGDCAAALEADARALLEARARFATTVRAVELTRLLLALIDAVGAPYEPDQGSTFATWLAKLDKPRAQSAWRLLAFVKRQTLEGKTIRGGWWRKARRAPSEAAAGRPAPSRPLSIEDARFRRGALEPTDRPPSGPPSAPVPFPPRGGDDAA